MSELLNNVFENASWVTFDGCESPYIRKNINVQNLQNATINICGLGFFELYVNGKRVSNDLLVPAVSDYEKRNLTSLTYPIKDTFTHRTYYLSYNIKEYLVEGKNTLAFILGNGWYNQYLRKDEGDMVFGKPKLIFSLNITDDNGEEEIVSDDSLRYTKSPIELNSLFYGYIYNSVNDIENWNDVNFDDSGWEIGTIIPKAKTIFEQQKCPTDKEILTFTPVLVVKKENTSIYDCGENITGWVRVKTSAPEDYSLKITYAENINEDFTLNYDTAGSDKQIQTNEYICNGKENTFEPKFTWHGFRFFEISNNYTELEVIVVNADIAITSYFTSNNDTLDWLYNSYINTQLGNMHCGIPSDCPHRERLGYTGDGQLTASSAMLMLDSKTFYDKWMQDIADCQDIYNGHIQHTAPFFGGGGGPGGWGSAIVIVPYMYYKYFNDKTPIIKYYDNMVLWLQYMANHCEDGLITHEEPHGWCLGDWCTPEKVAIPEQYVNTYFYIKCMHMVDELSVLIGKAPRYCDTIKFSVNSFVKTYYNPQTHSFVDGVQGSDSLAIDLGLGDEQTLQNLVTKYQTNTSFDTGIFGTDILIDVLFKKGYGQLAVNLLTNTTPNSFHNMMSQGATTLWENWDGCASHNHPMFGAVTRHLFHSILGINYIHNDYEEKILISPCYVDSLTETTGQVVLGGVDISVSIALNANGKRTVNISHDGNSDIPVYFIYNNKEHILPAGNTSSEFIV